MAKKAFKDNDLFDNPAARIPVCLCLDVSGSMNEIVSGDIRDTGRTETIDGQIYRVCEGGKTKLEYLKDGIKALYDDLKRNPNTRYAADVSIVTFADDAYVVADFSGGREQPDVYDLKTGGMTDMGKGVNLALDLLDARKNEYKDAGREYYQPWLFLMSDGDANGDKTELHVSQKRVNDLVKKEKLTFFPIGFGKETDFGKNNELNHFSETEKAIRYESMDYERFFKWIAQSMDEVSRSNVGDKYRPGAKPSGYTYMD